MAPADSLFTAKAQIPICFLSSITVGQNISGMLSAGDCSSRRPGAFADKFTFSGTAGQQVALSLSSPAFDTYLYLIGPGGTLVAEDDDAGDGTDSRIPTAGEAFTLPDNGSYTIEATSYSANATGRYTLSLQGGGEIDTSYFYRLTNDFAGPGWSLDGSQNTLRMAITTNFWGQYWALTSLGDGKYRLTNDYGGPGKSLDSPLIDSNYVPTIADTGNYTGQYWTLTPVGNGKYRLTNDYGGPGKSLDSPLIDFYVPTMAETANSSGQSWTLTRLNRISSNEGGVLRSSGGPGVEAQILNYHLSGDQFCFTVANTSSEPIYVVAIGFTQGTLSDFTQTGAGNFILDPELQILEFTRQEGRVLPGLVMRPHPRNAIGRGMSTTFCVRGDFAGLNANQIAESLLMAFDETGFIEKPYLPLRFTTGIGDRTVGFIDYYQTEGDQSCLDIAAASGVVITAVGFDSESAGAHSLDLVIPTPQPSNQNLKFTANPGAVAGHSEATLDFALVTKKNFNKGKPSKGIRPGETSSIFCINGAGSHSIYLRYQDANGNYGTAVAVSEEGGGIPLGGLKGRVGTRPR
jgi:hypothetical protein